MPPTDVEHPAVGHDPPDVAGGNTISPLPTSHEIFQGLFKDVGKQAMAMESIMRVVCGKMDKLEHWMTEMSFGMTEMDLKLRNIAHNIEGTAANVDEGAEEVNRWVRPPDEEVQVAETVVKKVGIGNKKKQMRMSGMVAGILDQLTELPQLADKDKKHRKNKKSSADGSAPSSAATTPRQTANKAAHKAKKPKQIAKLLNVVKPTSEKSVETVQEAIDKVQNDLDVSNMDVLSGREPSARVKESVIIDNETKADTIASQEAVSMEQVVEDVPIPQTESQASISDNEVEQVPHQEPKIVSTEPQHDVQDEKTTEKTETPLGGNNDPAPQATETPEDPVSEPVALPETPKESAPIAGPPPQANQHPHMTVGTRLESNPQPRPQSASSTPVMSEPEVVPSQTPPSPKPAVPSPQPAVVNTLQEPSIIDLGHGIEKAPELPKPQAIPTPASEHMTPATPTTQEATSTPSEVPTKRPEATPQGSSIRPSAPRRTSIRGMSKGQSGKRKASVVKRNESVAPQPIPVVVQPHPTPEPALHQEIAEPKEEEQPSEEEEGEEDDDDDSEEDSDSMSESDGSDQSVLDLASGEGKAEPTTAGTGDPTARKGTSKMTRTMSALNKLKKTMLLTPEEEEELKQRAHQKWFRLRDHIKEKKKKDVANILLKRKKNIFTVSNRIELLEEKSREIYAAIKQLNHDLKVKVEGSALDSVRRHVHDLQSTLQVLDQRLAQGNTPAMDRVKELTRDVESQRLAMLEQLALMQAHCETNQQQQTKAMDEQQERLTALEHLMQERLASLSKDFDAKIKQLPDYADMIEALRRQLRKKADLKLLKELEAKLMGRDEDKEDCLVRCLSCHKEVLPPQPGPDASSTEDTDAVTSPFVKRVNPGTTSAKIYRSNVPLNAQPVTIELAIPTELKGDGSIESGGTPASKATNTKSASKHEDKPSPLSFIQVTASRAGIMGSPDRPISAPVQALKPKKKNPTKNEPTAANS
ncbi:hypothetical protein Poli38472_013824 [Pythium oligandrum]|uniref:Uncharacterized protein n=1 Tax=Pythium oligandrum TaxID=41045 RepID=A0A8K1C2P5_PYTOL|nr:hypothetical protein Poli38472_013824 [Pythium oligandrum]|eukprot:TMW55062.1 hypothetical protein Poli38472_013824 [Pythium oligandrum]